MRATSRFRSKSEEQDTRNLAKYGRKRLHDPDRAMAVPWPGPFWTTFPSKGEAGDFWNLRQFANSCGAEMVLRGRDRDRRERAVAGNDTGSKGSALAASSSYQGGRAGKGSGSSAPATSSSSKGSADKGASNFKGTARNWLNILGADLSVLQEILLLAIRACESAGTDMQGVRRWLTMHPHLISAAPEDQERAEREALQNSAAQDGASVGKKSRSAGVGHPNDDFGVGGVDWGGASSESENDDCEGIFEETDPFDDAVPAAALAVSARTEEDSSGVSAPVGPVMFVPEAFRNLVRQCAKDVQGHDADARSLAAAVLSTVDDGEWVAAAPRLKPKHILLCSTCLGREHSVRQALPLQVWNVLPFQGRARIFVVTFGEDEAIHKWLQKEMGWAIAQGFLAVASGGSVGSASTRGPGQLGFPMQAAGEPPQNMVLRVTEKSRKLQFWHSSQAKNASHIFAAETVLREESARGIGHSSTLYDTLLVNLDSDNLFGRGYVQALLDISSEQSGNASFGSRPFPPIACRANSAGTTGREVSSVYQNTTQPGSLM